MNWKLLIQHTLNGTIDWNYVSLYIDNDGGYWSCEGDNEDIINALKKTYGEPDGYIDVVDILQAIGINADWV